MLSPSETQRFGRKSESNIRSPRFGKWEMRRGTSFWECEFREPRLLDHASEGLLENGKEQELEWGYGVWERVTTREVGMWKESQETHESKFISRSDRQFSGATLRPHPAAVNNAQLWRHSRAAVCCPLDRGTKCCGTNHNRSDYLWAPQKETTLHTKVASSQRRSCPW